MPNPRFPDCLVATGAYRKRALARDAAGGVYSGIPSYTTMAKRSRERNGGVLTAPKKSLSGPHTRSAAKLVVVLSEPSKASAAGRNAQRAFVAGVERALGEAKKAKIAVTVQGPDGRLVRGVPRRHGGNYVITDRVPDAVHERVTGSRRSPPQRHRPT